MREKKKGGCLTTFIVILLVFILAGRFGPDEFGGGSGGDSGSSTGTTEPVVDRLPNLDDSYENHIFLSAKNRGECQTLKGNVMITFLLVDDTAGSWSAEAVQLFQQEVEAAGDLLEDPKALQALAACDAVVLTATCGSSRYRAAAQQAEKVKDYNKQLIGCVLMDG